jgi:hypothetical protein
MKLRSSLATLFFGLFIAFTAFAGTVKDDFEDGKIASFWNPFPQGYVGAYPMVAINDADEHDGMLHIRCDGSTQKALWLKELISGDFEASVEYHDYPPNNESSTKYELIIRDSKEPWNNNRRVAVESGGALIMFSGKDAGVWNDNTSRGNWTSPDGKLIMLKTGNKVTASIVDGKKEAPIAKEYTFDFDPVIVSIYAMSWDANVKLTTGAFDNFDLTGPKVPNLNASAVTLKDKLPAYWGKIKTSVGN